jgi:hypothetical protein
MKNIPKKFMKIQNICFTYDLSNIQKCNFKECLLTSVPPLTMFLPFNYFPYSFTNWAPELLCDL